jgi:tetratricopeptide (TPR) repeat protein
MEAKAMQTENLLIREPDRADDFLSDFPRITDYVHLLESQKERDKSHEILNLLIEIVRTFHRETLQKTAHMADIYRMSVDNCAKLGRIAEATRLCEEGLQIFPQNGELQLSYGDSLVHMHQFEAAEKAYWRIRDEWTTAPAEENSLGLFSYRVNTALGEMYQRWGKLDEARQHFRMALSCRKDWTPALVGIVELDIIEANLSAANKTLDGAIERFGLLPVFTLCKANLAMILGRFEEADDILSGIRGELLGDDRFEYLIFQIDFIQADRESLLTVPYGLIGATAEAEAARIWLKHLRQESFQEDYSRIPKSVWHEEYSALDQAWRDIESESPA